MFKLTITIVLAALILVLSFSISKINQLSRTNDELLKTNQSTEQKLAHLEKRLEHEHEAEQTALLAQKTKVDNLVLQLAKQTQLVTSAQQRYETVVRNASKPDSTSSSSLKDSLERQKQIVTELRSQLQALRDQKSSIKKQTHDAQIEQSTNQKNENDQINQQITDGTLLLNELKQQYATTRKTYKNNQFDLDSAQKAQNLQAQIKDQTTLLQNLRNQRGADNGQWNYQKDSIRSQSQQQIIDLETSERDLSDRLGKEIEVQRTLELDLNNGLRSQNSYQNIIKSAETELRTQKNQLELLDSQLKAEQAQLARLQQTNQ